MSRRRGFTLVELLVVIAIVTVLIAIMLPALARARDQANRIKCAANLRAIGQGLALYTDQYGYYPGCAIPFPYPYGVDHAYVWPARVARFVGTRKVFYCPSQDARCEWTDAAPGPANRARDAEAQFGFVVGERLLTQWSYFSYGYNVFGHTQQIAEGRGLGDVVCPRSTPWPRQIRPSRVRCPSEMIAITDSTADGHSDGLTVSFGGSAPGLPGRVHGGGSNVLFCDGHVTWYHRDDLDSRTGNPLRRYRLVRMWNYDRSVDVNGYWE
jgi:prepilin-type N-terminal cleavage/methylation domain-containing protein/prepilin-type processing-associated H-X9-DG protein